MSFSYGIVDGSEEVDLILKGIYLGLQLNLVHVGTINILKEEKRAVLVRGLKEINNSRAIGCITAEPLSPS